MTPNQIIKALRKTHKQMIDSAKYFYKNQKEIISNYVWLCSQEELDFIRERANAYTRTTTDNRK